ncbi:MAG: PAS domain S-box protein, partial [Desulfohalobiaceae bacterium]
MSDHSKQGGTNAPDHGSTSVKSCGDGLSGSGAGQSPAEEESRYRALVEHAPVPIVVHQDDVFVFANAKAAEVLGAGSPEALLGRALWEFISPGSVAQARERIEKILCTQLPAEPREVLLQRLDGSVLVAEATGVFVTHQGRPAVQVVFQDVTSQHNAEQALRESEERYRTLFTNAPVAIGVHQEGRYVLINTRGVQILGGLRPEDVLGRSVYDFVHPGYQEISRSRVESVYRGLGEAPLMEQEFVRLDGSVIDVEVMGTSIRHQGKPAGLSMYMDVTERKRAERELREAKEAAESASRVKDEFLANMSHEIRTPLSGIFGMLNLLGETRLSKEQQTYVDTALSSGKNLLRLLSDVLDLSKLEAGKVEIVREPFEVREVVASAVEMFSLEAGGKGLELEVSYAPGVPDRLVGDDTRIRQILFNLVGNAVKFTSRGGVRVLLEADGPDDRGVVDLVVQVRDTGIGIPPDRVDEVFEAFVQADGTYAKRFQGTGLGLSIVKRLATLMGGEVSLASSVGEGTTVTVHIPLERAHGDEQDKDAASTAVGALPQLRILLAEDDRVNRMALTRLLEKQGHSVIPARDGIEVFDRLSQEHFDCVLMDIQMPRLDGLEAIRRIRRTEREEDRARLPIIVVSAYAMESEIERFLTAGADGCLSKPLHM